MEVEGLTIETKRRRIGALALGEGPLVLCVHGFPDHNRSFRHQLPALAEAGFRAVAPMLPGYEPASQLGEGVAAHHPLRIAEQIIDWARQLAGDRPVHLVGHDWGALCGYLSCQLEPRAFRSFCAIAVPPSQAFEDGFRDHPGQIRNSWYAIFFQLRGLADAVVAARDFAFIEKLWRDWSPGWRWEPEEMEALKATFRQPGVLRSALAHYRATLNPLLADSRRMRDMTHQPVEVRTLAVTGATDGCIRTEFFDYADAGLFPAGLRIERIEAGGHFVHQECPEVFNPILIEHLRAEHEA